MGEVNLLIDAISTQAEGIGRVEGKAVFVPFTLPGESWRVRVIERKKNYERALPVEPQEPFLTHPARVEPQCPYYGVCGGCHLQHVSYEQQLIFKRLWLIETFRRIGRIDVDCGAVAPAAAWEYRNKITLPLRRPEGRAVFAYHHIHLPNKLVGVDDCPIAHAKIRAALPLCAEALDDCQAEFTPPRETGDRGAHAVFRVCGGSLYASFYSIAIPDVLRNEFVSRLFSDSSPIDFIQFPADGGSMKSYARGARLETAPPDDAFLQVNDEVRDALYDHVAGLPYQKTESLLDGYAGVGVLSRRLTGRFSKVVGVEADRSTSDMARREAERSGAAVETRAMTMERFFSETRDRFDAMVMNPPRAGLSQPVRDALKRNGAADLVMISCHPAAMARDAVELMGADYRLVSLQPFDMFPQTYHLEAAAHLQRG
ncbi:MAG: TRAM domain-containing protein [bacterium]|nr:TRAM domain-containing protein [bacterium]